MRILLALAALLLTLPAWACAGLSASDGRIPQAPPGATVLAGYVTLSNAGAKPVIVHKVESADFESVGLHRTIIENGISKMDMLEQVSIPAHGQLQFAPGGLHLMLFKPRREMKPGEQAAMSFFCGDQKPLDVKFTVTAAP
ncbi:MAG: copper chaperone PCu(A)C [Stenotrophobium sp.]